MLTVSLTNATGTLDGSMNVTSVTKIATGTYDVVFVEAIPDATSVTGSVVQLLQNLYCWCRC